MKVAIHQPQYFPWSPYVHKAMSADIFVYLDTVQFSKNGLQNRNQIKTANGVYWLTIPVKQHLGQLILDTQIADSRASEKHWRTIQANYGKSVGFVRWHDELQSMLQGGAELLVDLAINSTEWMLQKLNVKSQRVRASQLGDLKGSGSQLVAGICRALGADTYLTGTGALAYLQQSDFSSMGCDILVQQWKPLVYEQEHPEVGFVQDLSTLDLLLNCPDAAEALIGDAGSWMQIEKR